MTLNRAPKVACSMGHGRLIDAPTDRNLGCRPRTLPAGRLELSREMPVIDEPRSRPIPTGLQTGGDPGPAQLGLFRSPIVRRGLRWAALAAVLVLSIALTLRHVAFPYQPVAEPFDWTTFVEATRRLDGSSLYAWQHGPGSYEYSYRYAPLFAWALVPVVALGLALWRALHVAVLLLLPWRVAVVTLLAWPFWEDVYNANVMTFAFVFGWLALAGSRWATGAYLILAMLVPRPLMLPLVAWIVWKRPEWRLPAAGLGTAMVMLTLLTGEAGPFVTAISQSDDMVEFARNFGPSRFLGLWWLAIGVPLAAWLTWRGRIGWASLAISPYMLPYHFLMVLLETAPHRAPSRQVAR